LARSIFNCERSAVISINREAMLKQAIVVFGGKTVW
jgi:hypothetical protein